jgi:hypothetical protein
LIGDSSETKATVFSASLTVSSLLIRRAVCKNACQGSGVNSIQPTVLPAEPAWGRILVETACKGDRRGQCGKRKSVTNRLDLVQRAIEQVMVLFFRR